MRLLSSALFTLLVSKAYAEIDAQDAELKKKPCPVSSSDDCAPGCGACERNYITKMDMYHVYPIVDPLSKNKNWSYFTGFDADGNIVTVADDGVFITGCNGGIVDSSVFNSTKISLQDIHYLNYMKYFIYADEFAPIPKNGDLVVEFEGSLETFKTGESPYPPQMIQVNDFRLASGIFSSFDPLTGMMLGFILTNDRVYTLYARTIGPNWTPTGPGNYASFFFLIPVKVRKPCDEHNMKTIWHGATKQGSWRLDGREVFRITKMGYLLNRDSMVVDNGGQEGPAFPVAVTYGFGTVEWTDAYPACKRSDVCCDCNYPTLRQALAINTLATAPAQYNPLLGQFSPAVYYIDEQDPTLLDTEWYAWGQGAVLKINKLVVYQDFCAGRKC